MEAKSTYNHIKHVRPPVHTVQFPMDIKEILEEYANRYHIDSLANAAKIMIRIAKRLNEEDPEKFFTLWNA